MESEQSEPLLDVDLLSVSPKIIRFRGLLSAQECALIRFLMLEALIYFGDTSPWVALRPGADVLQNASEEMHQRFGDLGARPLLRSQDSGHLSFYFIEPPDFMVRMIQRVAKMSGVHPNNVEPIYHIYVPGSVPANLHLDNFNKYLFPHRHLSVSLFLDDYEDGGTVFPLLLDSFGGTGGSSLLALEHEEIESWQRVLNEERMLQVANDAHAYAHRRVDKNEDNSFRHRVLKEAQEMCRRGRTAQIPVLPEKGTMYLWFNYLSNGEDDVRSLHAGCSSSTGYKMIGAFFLRDGSGPFREHDSFWHPVQPRKHEVDELQRQMEMITVLGFRFDHIAALFNLERQAVFELLGAQAAVR
ncbi:Uncharacterized protein SCF082_LOCUS34089, partial [Durusdinium trenchii]